jgi:hypothetical protein
MFTFVHAPRGNLLRLTGSACLNKVFYLSIYHYHHHHHYNSFFFSSSNAVPGLYTSSSLRDETIKRLPSLFKNVYMTINHTDSGEVSVLMMQCSGWMDVLFYSATKLSIPVICSCLMIISPQLHVRRVLPIWLYQTPQFISWYFCFIL